MPTPAKLFNALDSNALRQATEILRRLMVASPPEPAQLRASGTSAAPALPETELNEEAADFTITPVPNLLGVDPAVYTLIEQTLKVKTHLMFYGPPGTGKTTIAQHIAKIVGKGEYKLVTGTSDWTSQDIVGGYQPDSKGGITFMPGLILDNFNQPIIIDELNRVDIDKAIGPLFTVLSGQPTTLAYLFNPSATAANRRRVRIFPKKQLSLEPHEFAPTPEWRILATINTVDKASLYQMSYALSRRFAWVLIDVPSDLTGFIIDYLIYKEYFTEARDPLPTGIPLFTIWKAVNKVRPLGAAPIIDIIELCHATDEEFNFVRNPPTPEQQVAYLNGFYAFLLPLLDGILRSEAEEIGKSVTSALGINSESSEATQIRERVTYHAI